MSTTDDVAQPMNTKMMSDIGEIKGLLTGVSEMMRHQHENVNRRIDDMQRANTTMHASTNSRLDDLTTGIGKRLDAQESDLRDIARKADEAVNQATDTAARLDSAGERIARRAGISGGASGGVIAAGIEVVKYLLQH